MLTDLPKSRMQKLRARRRAQGAKAAELWIGEDTAARLTRLQQPDESLSGLVARALVALDYVPSDAGAGDSGPTETVPSNRAEDLGAVLLALVQALFPLDTPVYPRTLYGLTTFPLYLVNTVLAPRGYVLHATKTRVAQRFVTCIDKAGGTEPFGLFELRRIEEDTR